jgi:hypothetical protein
MRTRAAIEEATRAAIEEVTEAAKEAMIRATMEDAKEPQRQRWRR